MGTEIDGDAGRLAVVEVTDDEYENIHDVPFITLNRTRVGHKYEGEIFLTGVAETDDAHFRQLLDWAEEKGQRYDRMEYGDWNQVAVYFVDKVVAE